MFANSFVYVPSPKKLNPNSFVWLPIHSYIFPLQKKLNLNSFVCLPIHSYIFPLKKIGPQFIRMFSNSLVFFKKNRAPIHSYIFQIIRICSSAKKPQCAQQSVLLLSHSQSSGCHTVAVGIVTNWVVGFCPSLVTKWAVKLPGSRLLACHTESP